MYYIHIHIHVVSNSGKLILSILAFPYQMIFLVESFFWLAVYNCHLYHMFCGNRTPSGESFPWELGMLFQSCLVKSQWTYGKKLEAKSAPTPDNSYIVFKKKHQTHEVNVTFSSVVALKKFFPAPQSCDTFRTATLPLLAKFGIEEQLSFKVVGVMMSWGGGLMCWYEGMFGYYKTSNWNVYIYIHIEMLFCWCCHRWLMNLVSFVDWVWSCFRNKVQNRNDKMDREDDTISRFLHPN